MALKTTKAEKLESQIEELQAKLAAEREKEEEARIGLYVQAIRRLGLHKMDIPKGDFTEALRPLLPSK